MENTHRKGYSMNYISVIKILGIDDQSCEPSICPDENK